MISKKQVGKKSKQQIFIVGNWKMNPDSLLEAKKIIRGVEKAARSSKKVSTVLCPPFVFSHLLKPNSYKAGAQNVSSEERGSYTGEVSPAELSSLGISYVILGHSERRARGEIDREVAKKALLSIQYGLHPIVCIGEKVRDYDGNYLSELTSQIKASLDGFSKKHLKNLLIAYEPLWAIGAPDPMTNNDIHETVLFIRKILTELFGRKDAATIPILYGGAVDALNGARIVKEGQTQGLLVGRESLKPEKFSELIRSVNDLG